MAYTRMRQLGEAVRARLAAHGSDVPHYFEAEEAQRHKERRRLTWLALDGRIVPPDSAGAKDNEKATTPRKIDAMGSLRERVLIVVATESRQVTEHLANNVLVALHQLGMPITDFDGYRWPTQLADNAGRTLREHVCEIVVYPRFPIPNQIVPLPIEDYLAEAGDITTPVIGHTDTVEYADVPEQLPLNLGLTAVKPGLVIP